MLCFFCLPHLITVDQHSVVLFRVKKGGCSTKEDADLGIFQLLFYLQTNWKGILFVDPAGVASTVIRLFFGQSNCGTSYPENLVPMSDHPSPFGSFILAQFFSVSTELGR